MSTYQQLNQSSANWQLATLVTEDTYNRLKTSAGGSAVIYGVPMGGNYSQFRANVASRLSARQESWSASQLQNVLWTGLDPTAATAYRDCLNAQVFNQPGLQAAVIGASTTNILIRVRWNVPGQTTPATVTWTSPVVKDHTLERTFQQGETTIQVPRPDTSLVLAGSHAGYSTQAIALEPLPKDDPALSLAQKIRAGKTFVFVTDPGTTLMVPSTFQQAGVNGNYPVTMGFYRHTNRSWSTWASTYNGQHQYFSGTWCGQDACGPPPVANCYLFSGGAGGTCHSNQVKLMDWNNFTPGTRYEDIRPLAIDPMDGKLVVQGTIFNFEAGGRVFSADGVQRGYVFVPEFATEPAPVSQ